MDDAKALGNRLKALMAERGMTTTALASRCGISANELGSKYLSGQMLPNADLLDRLAKALNVTLADLRGKV
jgi:transcriptional regulator with XRE-family HTH domain